MSCTYDKERLTAFFDGELDAAERADTERHISGCSECLRDLGEIKSAALAVKSLPRPRAPKSIAEGVSREIAGAGRLRRLDVWRRRLFYGVAAAAALLVALNLSYFLSTPSAPQAAAKRPAPDLALAEGKKQAQEPLAKTETNALAREEKAANRQLAAQDKGAAEGGARRDVEREKAATDHLAKALPVVAPKADAAPGKPEAKQELQAGAPAEKPAAPPAPAAPRPGAELAKKSAAPADGKLKEMKDDEAALRGRLVEQAEKAREFPLAAAYTVGAAKEVDARAKVEALTRKWSSARAAAAKAPAAEAAPPAAAPKASVTGGGAGFGRAVEPLVLEITPAQLEELRAELAQAGATIEAGAPEETRRGAAKDGLGAVDARKRAELEQDRQADVAGPSTLRKVTLYFVEKKK